jgi:uncharacterized protein (DUF1684 family)
VYTASYQTEIYDDNGFIDIAGNPTRLTVGAGVTRVNIASSLTTTNTVTVGSTFEHIIRHKNSGGSVITATVCGAKNECEAVTFTSSVSSLGVAVTAGDYFEVIVFFSDSSVTLDFMTATIQDVS